MCNIKELEAELLYLESEIDSWVKQAFIYQLVRARVDTIKKNIAKLSNIKENNYTE